MAESDTVEEKLTYDENGVPSYTIKFRDFYDRMREEPGESFRSKVFEVDRVKFSLDIFPNGLEYHEGYVEMFLTLRGKEGKEAIVAQPKFIIFVDDKAIADEEFGAWVLQDEWDECGPVDVSHDKIPGGKEVKIQWKILSLKTVTETVATVPLCPECLE